MKNCGVVVLFVLVFLFGLVSVQNVSSISVEGSTKVSFVTANDTLKDNSNILQPISKHSSSYNYISFLLIILVVVFIIFYLIQRKKSIKKVSPSKRRK